MDDKKKTELWLGLVSKHTAAAKDKALADGSVAKETTQDPPLGDPPPVETLSTAGNDPLVAENAALKARVDALEKKVEEIGKAYDGAVAKAASDQAVAKAELDKSIADAKTLVTNAQAVADRIEALAPRGATKRIDERAPVSKSAEIDEGELLAQRTAEVLNIGKK